MCSKPFVLNRRQRICKDHHICVMCVIMVSFSSEIWRLATAGIYYRVLLFLWRVECVYIFKVLLLGTITYTVEIIASPTTCKICALRFWININSCITNVCKQLFEDWTGWRKVRIGLKEVVEINRPKDLI